MATTLYVFDTETDAPAPGGRLTVAVGQWLVVDPRRRALVRDGEPVVTWITDARTVAALGAALDDATFIVAYNAPFDLGIARDAVPGAAEDSARVRAWHDKAIDPCALLRTRAGVTPSLQEMLWLNALDRKIGTGLGAIDLWRTGDRASLERYCRQDTLQLVALMELEGPLATPLLKRRWKLADLLDGAATEDDEIAYRHSRARAPFHIGDYTWVNLRDMVCARLGPRLLRSVREPAVETAAVRQLLESYNTKALADGKERARAIVLSAAAWRDEDEHMEHVLGGGE